jgi:hypothetical protein
MSDLGKIFMLTRDRSLAPMEEHRYDSEDLLQGFLQQYPDLLGGEQMNPEDPRRWLLIRREMAVPDEEGATGRWSLDHLFVDQDGIPTLVECKRSTDSRTRREVVAQMLDYAANATRYWSPDRLRQYATETAIASGQDIDSQVLALLEESDPEALEPFWEAVERNLSTGRVRLIFVSDEIPRELRSIVEFLNDQMERTEVLAVEIKQFSGAETTVFAPRVLGASEAARQTKQAGAPPSPRRTASWTVPEIKAHLEVVEWDDDRRQLVERVLALGQQLEKEGELSVDGGTGQRPSFMLKRGNRNLLTMKGEAAMTIYYGFWHLPDATTEGLRHQLSVLLGDSDKVYGKEPNITPLLAEHDPELNRFRQWVRRVLEEFKRAEAAAD